MIPALPLSSFEIIVGSFMCWKNDRALHNSNFEEYADSNTPLHSQNFEHSCIRANPPWGRRMERRKLGKGKIFVNVLQGLSLSLSRLNDMCAKRRTDDGRRNGAKTELEMREGERDRADRKEGWKPDKLLSNFKRSAPDSNPTIFTPVLTVTVILVIVRRIRRKESEFHFLSNIINKQRFRGKRVVSQHICIIN